MKNLFLKASNEQELIEKLAFARYEEDGKERWLDATRDYALDVVGVINKGDAVFNEDGEVVKPATPIAGFHANIICNHKVEKLIPHDIIIDKPKRPRRIFAGR